MTSISKTYLCLFFPNWKIMMRSVWFNVSALLWTFYTIMIHILNNLYWKLSIICVLGELGDIDWQSSSIKPCCQHAPICEQLIEIANDHGLSQIVDKPTRTTSTISNILGCPYSVIPYKLSGYGKQMWNYPWNFWSWYSSLRHQYSNHPELTLSPQNIPVS